MSRTFTAGMSIVAAGLALAVGVGSPASSAPAVAAPGSAEGRLPPHPRELSRAACRRPRQGGAHAAVPARRRRLRPGHRRRLRTAPRPRRPCWTWSPPSRRTPDHPFRIGHGDRGRMLHAADSMPRSRLRQGRQHGPSGRADSSGATPRRRRRHRPRTATSGRQTRSARVSAFQRHDHLKRTGRADANTRFLLFQGAVTRGRA